MCFLDRKDAKESQKELSPEFNPLLAWWNVGHFEFGLSELLLNLGKCYFLVER